MTRVFACEGEDGRALDWPLLAAAARLCWGWGTLPETARSQRGKPYFPTEPGKWFSLSHSGGVALAALSDDGPVGADVERVRLRRSSALDRRALSEGERALCAGDPGEFTRLWTLKESWCKREDSSLWPPDQVVTPPPCPHRSWAWEGWRASVCCAGDPPEEIEWISPDPP